MARPADFFYRSYAHFAEQVQVSLRETMYRAEGGQGTDQHTGQSMSQNTGQNVGPDTGPNLGPNIGQNIGDYIGQNSWVTTQEYAAFVQFLALGPESVALEIASGSGGPAIHLARRTGCRVTGVDASPQGVEAGRHSAAQAGLEHRVSFEVADATKPLAFGDDSVDALICIDSMNHFTDRPNILKEWCRVLKPGGRAVFSDPVVITGPVTNHELAQRSAIGTFVFTPRGWNEVEIVKAGFRLMSQLDGTENASLVSRRWRDAREHFRRDLTLLEGETAFADVQAFLDAVHKLSEERRLSRTIYFVEKAGDTGRNPAGPQPWA